MVNPKRLADKKNYAWCRWRNSMASMLVRPSDRVEIMVKHVMMCSLCWSSDPGWITIKPGFY